MFNSSFTNFALMRKQHSFTKFAFMRNPHVYILVSMNFTKNIRGFNPLTAKLFNLNFHPLEVVSR